MIRLGSKTFVLYKLYIYVNLLLHHTQDTPVLKKHPIPTTRYLAISHAPHALCLLIPAYTLYMY